VSAPAPAPAATGRLLTERYEAIVRLVAAQGRATHGDVLSMYRAAPLPARALRVILDELTDRGWLDKLPDPARRRGTGVAWTVAAAALPHLRSGRRLTCRPGPCADHAPAGHTGHAAPPAAAAAAVTPPTYRPAPAPWQPPPTPPLRAGALDFLAVPSRGPFPQRPDLNP